MKKPLFNSFTKLTVLAIFLPVLYINPANIRPVYGEGTLTASGTTSSNPSDNLIKGFAKWQAGRIDKIILDQSFEKIAANEYVVRLFPNTVEAITFTEGQSRETTIRLFFNLIDQDLEEFKSLGNCIKNHTRLWITESSDTPINLRANWMYELVTDIVSLAKGDKKNNTIVTVKKAVANNHCEEIKDGKYLNTPLKELEDLDDKEIAKRLGELLAELKIQVELKKQKGIAALSKSEVKLLKNVESLKSLIKEMKKLTAMLKASTNNTASIQAYSILKILEYFGTGEKDYVAFKTLQKHVLFLANILEASKQGADVVEATLSSYIDEHDAYVSKRHHNAVLYSAFEVTAPDKETGKIATTTYSSWTKTCCDNTVFIGSNFGVSIVKIDQDNDGEKDYEFRAFGPVGLEIKLASYWERPVSLSYAPLDFGAYITNELRGRDYDAKVEDILSPSIYLSWSAKNRPFSILLGYQRDIRLKSTEKENSYFLSFAFDLPILTLY